MPELKEREPYTKPTLQKMDHLAAMAGCTCGCIAGLGGGWGSSSGSDDSDDSDDSDGT